MVTTYSRSHSVERTVDAMCLTGDDVGPEPERDSARNELPPAGARLFSVGLTRARDDIHKLYSGYFDTARCRLHWGRSPF